MTPFPVWVIVVVVVAVVVMLFLMALIVFKLCIQRGIKVICMIVPPLKMYSPGLSYLLCTSVKAHTPTQNTMPRCLYQSVQWSLSFLYTETQKKLTTF